MGLGFYLIFICLQNGFLESKYFNYFEDDTILEWIAAHYKQDWTSQRGLIYSLSDIKTVV